MKAMPVSSTRRLDPLGLFRREVQARRAVDGLAGVARRQDRQCPVPSGAERPSRRRCPRAGPAPGSRRPSRHGIRRPPGRPDGPPARRPPGPRIGRPAPAAQERAAAARHPPVRPVRRESSSNHLSGGVWASDPVGGDCIADRRRDSVPSQPGQYTPPCRFRSTRSRRKSLNWGELRPVEECGHPPRRFRAGVDGGDWLQAVVEGANCGTNFAGSMPAPLFNGRKTDDFRAIARILPRLRKVK